MKDEIITIETAMLAKEKGFNHGCKKLHGELGGYKGLHDFDNFNQSNEPEQYSAPTQSMLQRWLRETHSIRISIIWYDDGTQCYWAAHIDKEYSNGNGSFELALEFVLQKALKKVLS